MRALPHPGAPRSEEDSVINRDKLFIDGSWVPSTGTGSIDVINSATEEVMGRIPEGTAADVDRAVAAAKAAFQFAVKLLPTILLALAATGTGTDAKRESDTYDFVVVPPQADLYPGRSMERQNPPALARSGRGEKKVGDSSGT